jgi:hypothetical protein
MFREWHEELLGEIGDDVVDIGLVNKSKKNL